MSKKKSKEGDAEHSAVTVEESTNDNTEEAASFFGIRIQEGEWLKVLPGPSQEMKPKEGDAGHNAVSVEESIKDNTE